MLKTDTDEKVNQLNTVPETMIGCKSREARRKSLSEFLCTINDESHESIENPVQKALS